jgi:HK97 gp10 family phage protein
MSITVQGAERIIKRLENMKDTGEIAQDMGKACALVEAAAKRKAPKDTGDLRRSITSKVEASDDEVRGIVYTPLEYAPYVEYGTGLFAESGGRKDVPWFYVDDEGNWYITSGMHPQPYMRPALNENREQIIRILKEALMQ